MTKLYSWDNEGRGTDMVVSPEGTAVAVSDPEHECIRLFNAFQPGSEMDVRSRTIADPDGRVGDRISKLSARLSQTLDVNL